MKIKVGIAEDKRELRESLVKNLGYFSEVEVVFAATNGQDAADKCLAVKPNVILMDIEMPQLNGIEATAKVKAECPETKVIMLTVFDDDKRVMEAILAGASGYLLKEEHPGRVVEAVQELMQGGAPMSPSIALKTLNLIRLQGQGEQQSAEEFGISEREMQVLRRMADGNDYNAVSESLFISPKTVRNHIQNIYHKLHVNNKTAAINKAREMGWV